MCVTQISDFYEAVKPLDSGRQINYINITEVKRQIAVSDIHSQHALQHMKNKHAIPPRHTPQHATDNGYPDSGFCRISCFFKTLTLFAAIFVLAEYLIGLHPAFFFTGVFVLAAPVAVGGLYRTTIRKTRRLELFCRHGRIASFLSGRTAAVFFWTGYAVFTSFLMLIGLSFFHTADWILFFCAAPVFYILFRIFHHIFQKELRTYLVTGSALTAAAWLMPVVLLCAFAAMLNITGTKTITHDDIASAIAAREAAASELSGSILAAGAADWMAVHSGIRAYAAGQAGQADITLLSIAAVFLGGCIFLYNAANLMAACIVSGQELKRIVRPFSPDAGAGGSVRSTRFPAVASAAGICVALFATAFFLAETRIAAHPDPLEKSAAAREKIVVYAERIDHHYVRPGTITQLTSYRMDMGRDLDRMVRELETEIHLAFDDMTDRVDDFLDWYYSLSAEYARILHLAAGSAGVHFSEKLAYHLKTEAHFDALRGRAGRLAQAENDAGEQLHKISRILIRQNRIHPDENAAVEVSRSIITTDLPDHGDQIGFGVRMGSASAASAGGLLAGGCAGRAITAGVVRKTGARAAARVVFRFGGARVAGKGGGASAGAAAGAAVGSVLPGAGTAAGLVAGGAIGAVAGGLLADRALLAAEESMSREAFRTEIVGAIEALRMETVEGLYRATR